MVSHQKTFLRNFLSNVGFFALNTIVSVWFVSYLIRHLGIAVYGLVPLALIITSYLNLVTFVLNSAIGRHMTIALEQKNSEEVSKIFNTAFWGSVVLAGVVLLPGLFIIFFADKWLNLPPGHEVGVKWLFTCTISAFLLTTVGSTFNIVAYCRNRFDLQNLVNIASLIIRVVTIVVLFNFFTPDLWQVSLGILLAAVVSFIGSLIISEYLLPGQKIHISYFSGNTLRALSGTGIWMVISQIGTMLLLSIDLLVANKLFGPEQSGRYASVMQWSSLLRNFGMVVAGIFGPTIIAYYAKNEMEKLIGYSRKAVKIVGLVVALPVGLICGFSKPLLSVWLGPDFVILAPLMSLMTFHLCLNLGYLPLHSICMATNRVKVPAILQVVLGVVNLFLAILFAKSFKMGLYGIAVAGVLVLSLKNIVFNPIYCAYIIKKPYTIFMRELLPLTILAGIVGGIGWGLTHVIDIHSWMQLIICGGVVALFYSLMIWVIVLSVEEREFFLNLVKSNVKKLRLA